MPNQFTALPMPERFWAKVDKQGPIIRPEYGPCWVWTASLDTPGYGHINLGGVLQKSSRVAWSLAGSPAEGGHVLHVCDIRRCVRNDSLGTYEVNGILYERRGHLFLGDGVANVADKEAKGRGGHRGQLGASNPSAKLTAAQVMHIRERYARGGITQVGLANEYGVHFVLISQIVLRKIWRHI